MEAVTPTALKEDWANYHPDCRIAAVAIARFVDSTFMGLHVTDVNPTFKDLTRTTGFRMEFMETIYIMMLNSGLLVPDKNDSSYLLMVDGWRGWLMAPETPSVPAVVGGLHCSNTLCNEYNEYAVAPAGGKYTCYTCRQHWSYKP